MSIPIQNIYYLLSYAWDVLSENSTVSVDVSTCKNTPELLATVLESSVSRLLRRGLDREYIEESVDIAGVRGRINIAETVQRALLMNLRVNCTVDTLDYNVVQNQIIKSTLGKMLRCSNLDSELRKKLVRLYRHLGEVQEVPITTGIFGRVRIHRNNAYYRLPIEICRLIHTAKLVEEHTGRYFFRDFLSSERTMAVVFETFVRRFYEKEQVDFLVRRERIPWQATECSAYDSNFLPSMQTDVSLERMGRKIIVETKYYREALRSRFGVARLKSENLYQLFAYLRNLELRDGTEQELEGILLYPTTTQCLALDYKIHGHRVRVITLNLDRPWLDIHTHLLALLN